MHSKMSAADYKLPPQEKAAKMKEHMLRFKSEPAAKQAEYNVRAARKHRRKLFAMTGANRRSAVEVPEVEFPMPWGNSIGTDTEPVKPDEVTAFINTFKDKNIGLAKLKECGVTEQNIKLLQDSLVWRKLSAAVEACRALLSRFTPLFGGEAANDPEATWSQAVAKVAETGKLAIGCDELHFGFCKTAHAHVCKQVASLVSVFNAIIVQKDYSNMLCIEGTSRAENKVVRLYIQTCAGSLKPKVQVYCYLKGVDSDPDLNKYYYHASSKTAPLLTTVGLSHTPTPAGSEVMLDLATTWEIATSVALQCHPEGLEVKVLCPHTCPKHVYMCCVLLIAVFSTII